MTSARGRSVSTWAIIRTHPRHGALDLELAGADQRHVAEAELTRGVGRELADEVAGRGEDDRDEVVDHQVVGRHHVGHHLGHPVQHVLAGVRVELGRTPALPSLPRAQP